MNILGLSGGVRNGNQDGAAALLIDGQIVAAAEEERFVGIKFANGLLPLNAARFCLARANLTVQDLDQVVFAGATYKQFDQILESFFDYQFGYVPSIRLVDHHTAHAASAYFGSGWDKALIVTMDYSGDQKSTTVQIGEDGKLEPVETFYKPDSLGIYYSAVTQYLGFQKDSDEYKVMGMAGYGRPHIDFSHILETTDTGYCFHHDFLRGLKPTDPAPSKQERLFNQFPLPFPPRAPGSPITNLHFDIAASAQSQLEDVVLRLVEYHASRTGMRSVCLSGGVALNCLMNQKIRESALVDRLYVPPVCSDAGLALGAAYLIAKEDGDTPCKLDHAYWGPDYSSDEIRAVLKRTGVSYVEDSNPVEAATRRIGNGQIVGWFQGRMEYGPRALGNRSILASPRDSGIKDQINSRIKFREEFRPLAPSICHEHAPDYFTNYSDSPYMTQTFNAAEKTQRMAPAIVHVDGTSRLQSVHSGTNPLYAELVESVSKETGVPIVLNTSLNSYNDPIACEPFQALRTYFATGLDSLVIGDFVLDKTPNVS